MEIINSEHNLDSGIIKERKLNFKKKNIYGNT